MNDLEGMLKEKVGEMVKYLSVTELPDIVKARLVKWEFKEDSRGNKCFYIHLETEGKEIIVQKFTKSTWLELYDRLSRIGFDRLEKEYLTWVKANIGRAINPRLIPMVEKKR